MYGCQRNWFTRVYWWHEGWILRCIGTDNLLTPRSRSAKTDNMALHSSDVWWHEAHCKWNPKSEGTEMAYSLFIKSVTWSQTNRAVFQFLETKLKDSQQAATEGSCIKAWQSISREETAFDDINVFQKLWQSLAAKNNDQSIQNNPYVYDFVSLSNYVWGSEAEKRGFCVKNSRASKMFSEIHLWYPSN